MRRATESLCASLPTIIRPALINRPTTTTTRPLLLLRSTRLRGLILWRGGFRHRLCLRCRRQSLRRHIRRRRRRPSHFHRRREIRSSDQRRRKILARIRRASERARAAAFLDGFAFGFPDGAVFGAGGTAGGVAGCCLVPAVFGGL